MTRMLVLCFAVAACGGGGDGDDDPTPDGPVQNATVMSVACDGTEADTVETTGGFRFSPMAVTISAGQVVKFTNSPDHSVVPGATPTDPGMQAAASTSTCLKFTESGNFNYKCFPHSSMTGTITVN